MTKRSMQRERVQARREQATQRQEARNARGAAGQLDRLNKLGYTAQRERARLAKEIGQ